MINIRIFINKNSVVFGMSLVALMSCSHPAKREGIIEASSVVGSEPEFTVEHPVQTSSDRFIVLGKSPHAQGEGTLAPKTRIQGVELKNTTFDLPVVINSRVEQWIAYFTGRGRRSFQKYLNRSLYFIPYIEELLKEHNMPRDLVYLAMIESGFNNHARSRARAVGPWQFISATGKRYGLAVNWWIDERRDIHKSTLAAVRYLKDLYELFGHWELVAAGYNAGESKVARAIRRYGTTDFWAIARHRFLRPETRNYVPKLMAAAIISKNYDLFGFELSDKKEAEEENSLGAISGSLDEKLLSYSRSYMTEEDWDEVISQEASDYKDHLPARVASVDLERELKRKESERNRSVAGRVTDAATPHVSLQGDTGGEKTVDFEVQSPADLLKIARAAGVSYQKVRRLNPQVLRWCTPPSPERSRIRLPLSVKEKFLVTYNHPSYPRETRFRKYKVRKGDTLRRIARRFRVRVEPIRDLNNLSRKRTRLKVGEKILLPIPSDRTRSMASLGLTSPSKKRKKFSKVTYRKRKTARSRKKPSSL